MDSLLAAAASALWVGILTSISPCPLATNVAAISYLGRDSGGTSPMLLRAGLYTLGRTVVYIVLAAAIVAGLYSIPALSDFLQTRINTVLGPVLILTGMVVLDLLPLPSFGGGTDAGRLQDFVKKRALAGAALLGVVFALSFCPVSAALFFGSLIPLAAAQHSPALLPALYGIGTALPVVVFALLLAFGSRQVGKAFNALSAIDLWARRITGAIFIGAGIWFSLVYIFGVL